MTVEEKFAKGTVVYQNEENDYILELWGASTKHPDSIFRYSDWKDKSDMFAPKYQIMQWLFYCASKLTFPFYAKELVNYALKEWDNFNFNED